MNKILLILAGILVVALVVLGIFVFVFKPAAKLPPTNNGSTTFPISSSTSTTATPPQGPANLITVTNSQGQKLVVPNFESDPATTPDPSNAGYYYLAGGANETVSKAPFQIFYQAPYQYFGITLYQEPLGQYRLQAEQELMQKLGLTQEQMCSLNYDVSAGPGISPTYSTENLGFSFCPGAVALPQ